MKRGGCSDVAHLDVYANPNPSAKEIPYLLDVQSNLLDALESRIAVPLRRLDRAPAPRIHGPLMPILVVAGIECILETPKLAAVPRKILKDPIASLSDQRDAITRGTRLPFPWILKAGDRQLSRQAAPNKPASACPGNGWRMNASPTRNAPTARARM